MFSNRDVNEVAEVAPGTSVMNLLPKTAEPKQEPSEQATPSSKNQAPRMSTASIGPDGKVKFENVKEESETASR